IQKVNSDYEAKRSPGSTMQRLRILPLAPGTFYKWMESRGKTSGFYYLIEFKADSQFVATLETQYHRDERIIRFLTVALDKDSIAYAEHRRQKGAAKAEAPKAEEAPVEEPEIDVEPENVEE
ncbi:MAG: 30S ribosomal protein S6, partial [Bacteroidales bacterium]|nr:30S ribosomal protein S6 [Bacteroidales bacterium]